MSASFAIVALVLAIIAAILGLVGKKRLETVKGPEQAMAQLEATKKALASTSTSTSTSTTT